jgi:hypothetical protein
LKIQKRAQFHPRGAGRAGVGHAGNGGGPGGKQTGFDKWTAGSSAVGIVNTPFHVFEGIEKRLINGYIND